MGIRGGLPRGDDLPGDHDPADLLAAPPVSERDALLVAAEHFALCPDNIWQGSRPSTLAAYAVVNSPPHRPFAGCLVGGCASPVRSSRWDGTSSVPACWSVRVPMAARRGEGRCRNRRFSSRGRLLRPAGGPGVVTSRLWPRL
ncbi:DUF4253 domain-containing protein [Streptomyces sp. SID1121]|uniref:DUF4253 domain-containing protein n=1 Tax=Streptomyces sp. SID1121 TaxID=3425888 RepID=UPI004056E513